MDFSQFIREKGVRALAIVFEAPESTIYAWLRRNCIPRKNWDRLIEVYPKISFKDLVAMEKAAEVTQ